MAPTNITLLLIFFFFGIVFTQSGFDKVFNKKDNLDFLYEVLGKTFSKLLIIIAFYNITFLEVLSGLLCFVGIFEYLIYQSLAIGFWGLIIGAVALLILLFGQRMSKNYEGAKTIAIYFMLNVFALSLF